MRRYMDMLVIMLAVILIAPAATSISFENEEMHQGLTEFKWCFDNPWGEEKLSSADHWTPYVDNENCEDVVIRIAQETYLTDVVEHCSLIKTNCIIDTKNGTVESCDTEEVCLDEHVYTKTYYDLDSTDVNIAATDRICMFGNRKPRTGRTRCDMNFHYDDGTDDSFSTVDYGKAWWDTNYAECRDFNYTNPESVELQNYTVLVEFNASLYTPNARTDGYDIVFVNNACGDGGDQLDHELEVYDSTGANLSRAWIRMTLPAGGTNEYAIYSNYSEATDNSDPLNAWSRYSYVYHLNNVTDAKLANALTNAGGVFRAGGIVGDTVYVNRTETDGLNRSVTGIQANGTMMVWTKITGLTSNDALLSVGNDHIGGTGNDVLIKLGTATSNTDFICQTYANNGAGADSNNIVDTNTKLKVSWYFTAMEWNGTGAIMSCMINSTNYGSEAGDSVALWDDGGIDQVAIGRLVWRGTTNTGSWDSDVDEAWISSERLGTAWLNATYKILNGSTTYWSIGPLQVFNVDSVVSNHTITPDPAYVDSDLNCSLNISDDNSAVMNVSFSWSTGAVQNYVNVANNTMVNDTITSGFAKNDNVTCTVGVYDGFANTTSLAWRVISNAVPTGFNITAPTEGQVIYSTWTWLMWTCTDLDGDMRTAYWIINGTSNGTSTDLAPYNLSGLEPNLEYNLTGICGDGDANSSAVYRNFSTSNLALCNITMINPCDGCRYRDAAITLEYTCTPGTGIVDSCYYTINDFSNESLPNCTSGVFNISTELGWNKFSITMVDNTSTAIGTDFINFWAKKYDPDSMADYTVILVMLVIAAALFIIGGLLKTRLFFFMSGVAGLIAGYEMIAFSMIAGVFVVVCSGLFSLAVMLSKQPS